NEGTDIGRENLWLYGHTSWHTSHPYRCSPIAPCNSAGISPLSSIVRYEMHRVASSMRGSTIAPVGQASMHRVQLPQWSAVNGVSAASGRSIKSVPRKKNDPARGLINIVFFPCH